jgi:outer membrane protein insertion porin family
VGAVFGDATRFPLERFFLGGTQFGQSLRGYEESTVTPFGYFDRSDPFPSTNRLGNAFLVVSGEYAIRLSDAISVAAFAEGGNIWSRARDINPARLFRTLGAGATVVTPFGPLGVDVGYGFDRPDPGWKFHFKINQPGF